MFCKSLALLETSQIVETERIQLQAEMDRRLSEFERNHTASLVELETNRHDLMQQLDEMELINRELKNEIFSVQQKLQAKVCQSFDMTFFLMKIIFRINNK